MKKFAIILISILLTLCACSKDTGNNIVDIGTNAQAAATVSVQVDDKSTPAIQTTPVGNADIPEELMLEVFSLFEDSLTDTGLTSLTKFVADGTCISSAIMLPANYSTNQLDEMRDLINATLGLLNSIARMKCVAISTDLRQSAIEDGYYGGLYDYYDVSIAFADEAGNVLYRGSILKGQHYLHEEFHGESTSSTATQETVKAYVNASTLNLRAEPNTESDILNAYSGGQEIEIVGEEGDWFQVIIAGTMGYMLKDYIMVGTAEPSQSPTASPSPTPTAKPSTSPTATPSGRKVYITKTGKKYHYNGSCNGGTYYESTLEDAKKRGLEPCNKCVN